MFDLRKFVVSLVGGALMLGTIAGSANAAAPDWEDYGLAEDAMQLASEFAAQMVNGEGDATRVELAGAVVDGLRQDLSLPPNATGHQIADVVLTRLGEGAMPVDLETVRSRGQDRRPETPGQAKRP